METIRDTMQAWRVHQYGDFNVVLRHESCASPQPTGSQGVIRVSAIGLNFLDVLSIAGKYQVKSPLPFIPGVEAAGRVVAAGPDCPFALGERVMTVGGGAFAEYMTVDPENTFAFPDGMTAADAAALQLVYQTAHVALIHRARIRADDVLLVHAGAGGVGTAAIQIGRAHGARVIATAGSAEKLRVCRDCGAEAAVNYRDENFVDAVRDFTDGRGADVVFDPVGGSVFNESTRCIAPEGRIVVIGFAAGKISTIAVNRILLKNIDIIGVFWGNYKFFDPDRFRQTQSSLYDLYRQGGIKPVIYQQYDFTEIRDALASLANRKSYGKVIVNAPPGG